MKKTCLVPLFYLLSLTLAYSQSNQKKAQELVIKYLSSKSKFNTNIKFNTIEVLRSSFADTRQYKSLTHKIDSLKLEGRKIDARIPKMKPAELIEAKKESKHLSNQLVAASDQLIDFMTEYKGSQVGWIIKLAKNSKIKTRKTFYLNQELTKVDSVR